MQCALAENTDVGSQAGALVYDLNQKGNLEGLIDLTPYQDAKSVPSGLMKSVQDRKP